jgi:leucyl aminopeptidase (aminopeptidase T)
MASNGDLERALEAVLRECLRLQAGETLVVLTDPRKRDLAEGLVARGRDLGAEAVLVEMAERETHGSEPPGVVAAALLQADVVVAPTSKSVSHTQARQDACDRGARIATMPDATEDMLARTMGADMGELRRRSGVLAGLLSEGSRVRISTQAGTDVELGIEGRTGIADDGDLGSPGAFGNLPPGEGFIAPVEKTAAGTIVFDGSIWPLGLLEEPLTVEIRNGYIVDLKGRAAKEWRAVIEPHGQEAFAVAELGIGTNDAATLTGNVLEDEKILGTIHVAFGDNHTFGGNVRVSSHQDGIVLDPTVYIDDRKILEAGELLV